MTMYYNAGLNVMHMILHVESECYVRDVTRGRMWRIINIPNMNDERQRPSDLKITVVLI